MSIKGRAQEIESEHSATGESRPAHLDWYVPKTVRKLEDVCDDGDLLRVSVHASLTREILTDLALGTEIHSVRGHGTVPLQVSQSGTVPA